MNYINLFKVAFKAISNNKFRSFLSMLGIIIGVAAVIIMMAIGQGSKQSVRENISQMGTNLIMIRPGADMRGGVRQDPSAMQTLKQEDYDAILQDKKYIHIHLQKKHKQHHLHNVIHHSNHTLYNHFLRNHRRYPYLIQSSNEYDC